MSEVKRYTFKGAAGYYVYSKDYDAAQSELAVLNEHIELLTADLAWSENDSHDQSKELAALREELETSRIAHHETAKVADALQQRLTAAEQRNAQHEGMLRHFASCADVRQVGTLAMGYVAALTKPTESGASDTGKPAVGSVVIVCGGIKATVKAHHPDGLVVGAGDGYIVNEWRASE